MLGRTAQRSVALRTAGLCFQRLRQQRLCAAALQHAKLREELEAVKQQLRRFEVAHM